MKWRPGPIEVMTKRTVRRDPGKRGVHWARVEVVIGYRARPRVDLRKRKEGQP